MANQLSENIVSLLAENFQAFEQQLNGERRSAVHEVRKAAMENFRQYGFPTLKNEEWKYTNVTPILKSGVFENAGQAAPAIQKEQLTPFLIPNLDAELVVISNGRYNEALSTASSIDGITIKSFRKALKEDTKTIEAHLSKESDYKGNPFSALNTAFAYDGVYIHIGKGKTIEKPVLILHVTDTSGGAQFHQPRNLVIAEENSEAKIIEVQVTLGDNVGFENSVTEIKVAASARLEVYKLQNDKVTSSLVDTTTVTQEHNSLFSCYTFSLNGNIIRNNTNLLLNGKHIESHLFGLYLLQGTTHVDNHTLADHAYPDCMSNELYKGIMQDQSTGVFNGKVMVRQDAQRTNAFQTNNNLLLSDNATINTKPQLEIFADDVKCSHGATTGQMDETALYYLRSRGISGKKAQALLVGAFAGEVLEEINIAPLKTYIEKLVRSSLNLE